MDTDLDFAELLQQDHKVTELEAGDVLFKKGDHGDCMYVVKSGAIRLGDGSVVYETVEAGGLLGEMALIDESPRSASATAASATEVVAINQAIFLKVVHQKPFFAIKVARLLTRRLRAMNERI